MILIRRTFCARIPVLLSSVACACVCAIIRAMKALVNYEYSEYDHLVLSSEFYLQQLREHNCAANERTN